MPPLISLYLGLTAIPGLAPVLARVLARRAHRRMECDVNRLGERFGRATLPRPKERLVWINAASMGELTSVLDLIHDLVEAGLSVLVTTTSQSGAALAASRLAEGAFHQFQPVDTHPAVTAFLDHWHPDCACFVESDLWPRTLSETAKRGIPMALINARPSKSRNRAPATARHLLKDMALITAQDSDTARDIAALDLSTPIAATGDLKAAARPLAFDATDVQSMQAMIGTRPVWLAASTHPADEPILRAAQAEVLKFRPDTFLIHAPRHPERREAIVHEWAGHPLSQRSTDQGIDAQTEVYLADTLGEMGLWLRLAPLVFLGGSFGKEGGHNPHEPRALGCKVLHGPNVGHFRRAYASLDAAGLAEEVSDAPSLAAAVLRGLDQPRRQPLADQASIRRRTVAGILTLMA